MFIDYSDRKAFGNKTWCFGKRQGGECDHLNQVDEKKCTATIEHNRDVIVGVKVRLSEGVTDGGRLEKEVFRRALAVSRQSKVPLMVHHIISTIPVQPVNHHTGVADVSCPGHLSTGDIYTHCFHGHDTTIVDERDRGVFPAALESRERGVVFDIGHGQGSFSWKRAKIAMASGFFPDTISTDLHSGNIQGPVYDLPLVMSRLLHLGMPIKEVIASVTCRAARAIGKQETLGSLEVGREADITVLKLVDCDIWLEDCQGEVENLKHLFVPVAVWRAGKQYAILDLEKYPYKNQ